MKRSVPRIIAVGIAILLVVSSVYALAEDRIYIPIQTLQEYDNSAKIDITLYQEKPISNHQVTAQITIHDEKINYCIPASIEGRHEIITSETTANVTFEYSNREEYRVYFTDSFDLIFTPRVSDVKYYVGKIKLDFYDSNDQWICNKVVTLLMDTLTGEYRAFYITPY
jgi:hypothetical protein